jgi:putative acetyltransferase
MAQAGLEGALPAVMAQLDAAHVERGDVGRSSSGTEPHGTSALRAFESGFGSPYSVVVPDGEISIDDPRADDVRDLLAGHLAFANLHSPPEDVHALDEDGLLNPAVTFFTFRSHGELLGVGALKQLDSHHAEVKCMHTVEVARGRGVGRAMLDHLIGVARDRGFRRLSLETGSMSAFAPARSMYTNAGFSPCDAFGDYRPSRNSTFMTLSLNGPGSALDPANKREIRPPSH